MGDDRWWDHMDGGMVGRHMDGTSWWPVWWVLLVLLVGAVVALVVAGTRSRPAPPSGSQPPPPGTGPVAQAGDPAEALLRERYARGEIDQAEYDQRLARLRASR
ncbi:MAG: SHOCT domain-containing protein [Angustibacter sp.]